jgi:NAD(P)-dependent dehydrogenase (short-subunit alcohol dehydrogenase family)
MSTATDSSTTQREPQLRGQTVVLIGAAPASGLRPQGGHGPRGADVILTGRNPDRLKTAAGDVGAVGTATFDANDLGALKAFFAGLKAPIDHVLVTAGGPYYASLAEMDFAEARRALRARPMVMLGVARYAAGKVRPGGTLLFMGGTVGRSGVGVGISEMLMAALPSLTASLALEIAPVRVNLIAAGFVDTALSASVLGDALERRREQLRNTLPIGRVVGPADVAALAVHIMSNTALTGATYDVDGGQQLVAPTAE